MQLPIKSADGLEILKCRLKAFGLRFHAVRMLKQSCRVYGNHIVLRQQSPAGGEMIACLSLPSPVCVHGLGSLLKKLVCARGRSLNASRNDVDSAVEMGIVLGALHVLFSFRALGQLLLG
jgi:hypothetical protein